MADQVVTAPPAPAGSKSEIGWPINWAIGNWREEFIPQLFGTWGIVELDRMQSTDETIGAIMWLIETTMAQVNWKHIPCKDGKPSDDPKAVEAAEFADSMMEDMRKPWADHVEDTLTMIWAGFAPCEIVTKQRDGVNSRFNDGLWGIDHLPLRDPATIFNWVYNGRDLVGMQQVSMMGSAIIPMWKVLNYRVKSALDRPQGRSLFYNAYRVWRLKQMIQDSEAIGIERELCGLPVFRLPNNVLEQARQRNAQNQPTPEALKSIQMIQSAQAAVRDMRFNRSGGLVLPSDPWSSSDEDSTNSNTPMYDFSIVKSTGQRAIDARSAVKDYDFAILRLALMQFLQLGMRTGGSNALGSDQSSMAVRSLTAVADKIARTYGKANRYVWSINAMDMTYLPKLEPSQLSKDSIEAIGTYFRGLGSLEWLMGNDKVARTAVLDLAGIPSDPDAQTAPPPPPNLPPNPMSGPVNELGVAAGAPTDENEDHSQ